jgi:hypothetical protein
MICNALGCDTEAFTQVMFYHFGEDDGSRLQADHEVLHQSCDNDFRFHGEDTSVELRRIDLDIKYKEYLDFLSVCIEEELSVKKNLQNIIRCMSLFIATDTGQKSKIDVMHLFQMS